MARTITITPTPQEVIPANPQRDVLEIKNAGAETVFVRHGGTLDVASAANCGMPMEPGAARSISGAAAREAVQAAVGAGKPSTELYFHEYFTS